MCVLFFEVMKCWFMVKFEVLKKVGLCLMVCVGVEFSMLYCSEDGVRKLVILSQYLLLVFGLVFIMFIVFSLGVLVIGLCCYGFGWGVSILSWLFMLCSMLRIRWWCVQLYDVSEVCVLGWNSMVKLCLFVMKLLKLMVSRVLDGQVLLLVFQGEWVFISSYL